VTGNEASRIPIDPTFVERRLADREVPWPAPHVVATTGSTNADLMQLAREGAPEGTVIVADEQTAGRGRLGRSWVSAPGSGLWCSVLVRMPAVDGRGLLPLVAGVAVADAIRRHGVGAVLKWPNDVVMDGPALDGSPGPRKLAGVLSEADGDEAVVIGIGVNVSQSSEELPIAAATSLALEGAEVSRQDLLVDILTTLHAAVEDVRRNGAATAMGQYRWLCLTVGRDVTVLLPSGEQVSGRAEGVADDGQLIIDVAGQSVLVAAGDVIHATI
jgi:BirA family biotin operon repressor/biotin-[acetyl-CoA-carboxylase] ligase